MWRSCLVFTSLSESRRAAQLLGQAPNLPSSPKMPPPMGGTHTGSLYSPHPHCPEQLFSWKKQSSRLHLCTSEPGAGNAAACSRVIKDRVRKPVHERPIWAGASTSGLSALPGAGVGNPSNAPWDAQRNLQRVGKQQQVPFLFRCLLQPRVRLGVGWGAEASYVETH